MDVNIQCDNVIKAKKPDLILVNKKEHKATIIDIVVDVTVEEKEMEKVEKYQELKREIKRL